MSLDKTLNKAVLNIKKLAWKLGQTRQDREQTIAEVIVTVAEDAYRQGRRDERKRRKASCARRWRRKQAQIITPANIYPECQCIAQTPYKGHWHEAGCPLWEPELILRITGKTSTANR